MKDDLFTDVEVLPPVAKNGNSPVAKADDEAPSTALVLLSGDFTPLAVVQQPETRKAFYDHVKAQFDAYVPDMTTDKGRKAFASMAYKANTAKADIERAANQLTEEWRQKTDQVIQARKEAVGEIEKLRLAFIKPLDDWKQAEKDREDRVRTLFAEIKRLSVVTIDATSETVAAQIAALDALTLSKDDLLDRYDEADDARQDAAVMLEGIQARLIKEEADRARLAQLEAEAEQRRKEEADRIVAEQERQRLEKEAADLKAKQEADAKAEAERQERIRQEAAERARREAEARAKAEQDAKDRAYQEQIAAEKRRADEAEAQRKADAERIERERQAEAKRIEDERLAKERTEREARAAEEKRQADQVHRGRIMKAAKEALMEHADIAEDVAKRVVIAITGNNIPAVAITF